MRKFARWALPACLAPGVYYLLWAMYFVLFTRHEEQAWGFMIHFHLGITYLIGGAVAALAACGVYALAREGWEEVRRNIRQEALRDAQRDEHP